PYPAKSGFHSTVGKQGAPTSLVERSGPSSESSAASLAPTMGLCPSQAAAPNTSPPNTATRKIQLMACPPSCWARAHSVREWEGRGAFITRMQTDRGPRGEEGLSRRTRPPSCRPPDRQKPSHKQACRSTRARTDRRGRRDRGGAVSVTTAC